MYKIVESSLDSIQIQFEQKISEKTNCLIRQFCILAENLLKKDSIKGIVEIVPTYCSITIYFNPFIYKDDLSFLYNFINNIIKKVELEKNVFNIGKSKIHKIPVCYEAPFSLDIENIEKNSGLSKKQIISLHTKKTYLIYMLGFLPGFPYLAGMDERLNTPRLTVPRTKIPSGSIAIGGSQTGLYPVESPGGWQIIGCTPIKTFNNKTFLFKAGDRIKFVPISEKRFYQIKKSQNDNNNKKEKIGTKEKYIVKSGIKIVSSGLLTTIQDSGTKNYQKYGVGESGAMDMFSFNLANKIIGNSLECAALEITLCGPTIKFVLPCDFVVTGAFVELNLDGKKVLMFTVIHASEDSILSIGIIKDGLRSYISFSGGIIVPKVFGSRSTNTKSGIGGFFGRKINSDDELAIGSEIAVKDKISVENMASIYKLFFQKEILLHVLPCSQWDFFTEIEKKDFFSESYTVSEKSDRMGIRLDGKKMNCKPTDIISDSIPYGAIQITSSGMPVIMAKDRQTCGGYAKIACVIPFDMNILAQAIPGTKVRFELISREKALEIDLKYNI